MRFHFATVPVHGSAAAQRELNAFLAAHRVLGIERHLIADGAQSAWAICVAYTEATAHDAISPGRGGAGRKERVDYREAASSGSGCAVERSPGLRLSGVRTRRP